MSIKRKVIFTKSAPTPGNYNQAIVYSVGTGYCFECAGQTGNFPPTEDSSEIVVPGGIGPQTTWALRNLKEVIEAAGGKLEHITKVDVSMENMKKHKGGFEQAYVKFFRDNGIGSENFPTRETVGVAMIPTPDEDTIVEISCRGYIPKDEYSPPKED